MRRTYTWFGPFGVNSAEPVTKPAVTTNMNRTGNRPGMVVDEEPMITKQAESIFVTLFD